MKIYSQIFLLKLVVSHTDVPTPWQSLESLARLSYRNTSLWYTPRLEAETRHDFLGECGVCVCVAFMGITRNYLITPKSSSKKQDQRRHAVLQVCECVCVLLKGDMFGGSSNLVDGWIDG